MRGKVDTFCSEVLTVGEVPGERFSYGLIELYVDVARATILRAGE